MVQTLSKDAFCHNFSISLNQNYFLLGFWVMANFVSFGCNTDVGAVCMFITFWSIYVSSLENAVVLSPTRVMMHLNEVENLDQTVEVAIMGWCPADWSTCHEYVRVNLSCWLDTKVKTWPFHQSCFSVENIKRRWERGVKGFAKWMVNVMGVGRERQKAQGKKKPWSRFNGFVSLSTSSQICFTSFQKLF